MAVRFDAANDRVTFSAEAPPSTFTLLGWVYNSVGQGTFATFARLHAAAGGATVGTFATDGDGTSGPGYFTAGGSIVQGTGLPVGVWRKVAFTRSGSSGQALVAAVGGATEVDSGTVSSTAPTGITLGGRSAGDASEWWNGRHAYWRMFAAVLSQAEIEAEWASATPVRTADLWADWPLTDASTLTDASGNGRHLVAGSTAVSTEDGPPIAGTTTGVLAGTLPKLAGTLAAEAAAPGVLAGLLPELAGSAAGTASATGVLAGVLPGLVGALAQAGDRAPRVTVTGHTIDRVTVTAATVHRLVTASAG